MATKLTIEERYRRADEARAAMREIISNYDRGALPRQRAAAIIKARTQYNRIYTALAGITRRQRPNQPTPEAQRAATYIDAAHSEYRSFWEYTQRKP